MNLMNRIKQSSFIKDLGITTAGQILVMVLTFLLNKIISTRFGPEIYMEYSLINKTAGVITYVMILSLGIALPRYLAIYRSKGDKEREYTNFIASAILVAISTTVVFTVCILFREQFALWIFGKDMKFLAYVLPTLLLALQLGLTTLLYSYYRGIDSFFMYSISQCFVSIILVVISIFANELLLMVYAMSFAGLLFSLTSFIIYYRKYKKEGLKIQRNKLKIELRSLTSYSLPRVPGEFILFSFTTVPLIIINQRIGPMQAVAFSVALGIVSAISPFFRYIGMVLLPYASKSAANDQFDDLDRKMRYLTLIYTVASVCGIIFVLLFTDLVITILYSSEYVQYANVVKIMIFSLLPNSIYLLLRNPLDALSRFPINTINLIVSFSVMLAIVYFSNSEVMYAFSYFIAYTLLGVMSWGSWILLKRKRTANTLL